MKTNVKMKALKCAFPHTIPIMTGSYSWGCRMEFICMYPVLASGIRC